VAERIEKFTVTAASGTVAPGDFTALDFTDGIMTRIEVKIPDGHAGLTGIRIFYGNQQVLPRTGPGFLRGNATTYATDVDNLPSGSGWQARVFNEGYIDHSWELVLELDELGSGSVDLPPVLLLPYRTAV
jgi:hypothetical protein